MTTATQLRKSWTRQTGGGLILLSLLFWGAAACAPVSTQPVDQAMPTSVPQMPSPTTAVEESLPAVPSGWDTYTSPRQCVYAISHPADMEGANQDMYSWLLSTTVTDAESAARNFVYVSVIPDDFQAGGDQIIYNYDPAATETLLALQVGESKSLRADSDAAQWFTYKRLPDTLIDNQTAQTYENTQPWEFPAGTKEIRYYLNANGCTHLIGGYLDTTGSGQAGTISEDLFDQIIATFRLNS